jgi:hypothetical protein
MEVLEDDDLSEDELVVEEMRLLDRKKRLMIAANYLRLLRVREVCRARPFYSHISLIQPWAGERNRLGSHAYTWPDDENSFLHMTG